MAVAGHDLAAEVLDLSAENRGRMLESLISSFESTSDAQKACMILALHRREEVQNGKVAVAPKDEAPARVRGGWR